MKVLVLGLILFLAVHSARMLAGGWRTQQIARLGANGWKGIYSIVSIVGLGLIVWGYGLARVESTESSVLWNPPSWTRHAATLLMVPAFVLLAAAYVPGNRIKAAVGHPMVLSVKTWALAHLLANGRLADVILFGAFLLWAVFNYRAARQRDRQAGMRYTVTPGRDAAVLVAGLIAWAVFAFVLHRALIGVSPLG
jgi:uncharacterized membrane protein